MDLLSVIVCTYNRSRSLQETLAGLLAQQADGFACEVVVVDNNSSDDTRQVVAAWVPRFGGRLRYVFEGRQGSSYARNTGLQSVRSSLVAFLDDDVRPDPEWLRSLYEAFHEFRADCVYGKVVPLWMGERPDWLGPYFLDRLAMIDRGERPFEVTSPRQPFVSANVAMKKNLCEQVGAFNVSVGNQGSRVGGEEDTDLFERLLAAGARVVYIPRAVVHHVVGPERMSLAYFRRWHFDHGLAAARVIPCERHHSVLGIPFWAIRRCLAEAGTYLASLGPRRRAQRIIQRMKLVYYAGLFLARVRMVVSRELPCGRS